MQFGGFHLEKLALIGLGWSACHELYRLLLAWPPLRGWLILPARAPDGGGARANASGRAVGRNPATDRSPSPTPTPAPADPLLGYSSGSSGPASLTSMTHAAIVGCRGVLHCWTLHDAPLEVQLSITEAGEAGGAWQGALQSVELTNHLFLSYLVFDLLHNLAVHPRLGGVDMLVHHVLFIACSAICGGLRVLGFAFAWLITGELSTVWLGVRWLLIKSGRGATRAMAAANAAFALTFLATRGVVYGLGLAHLLRTFHAGVAPPMAFATLPPGSEALVLAVVALLVGGFALNGVWALQIVKIAAGGGERIRRPGAVAVGASAFVADAGEQQFTIERFRTAVASAMADVPDAGLIQVFDSCDHDGSGRLSRSEFLAAVTALELAITPDELDRMMAFADADGDGELSRAEFTSLASPPRRKPKLR